VDDRVGILGVFDGIDEELPVGKELLVGVGPGSRETGATRDVGRERGKRMLKRGSEAAASIGGWTRRVVPEPPENSSRRVCQRTRF
jgi:hypothetical protein